MLVRLSSATSACEPGYRDLTARLGARSTNATNWLGVDSHHKCRRF